MVKRVCGSGFALSLAQIELSLRSVTQLLMPSNDLRQHFQEQKVQKLCQRVTYQLNQNLQAIRAR